VVRGVPKDAFRTHSAQQAPLWGGLVTRRVLFARAPVLGLCFFVSVKRSALPQTLNIRARGKGVFYTAASHTPTQQQAPGNY